MSLGTKLKNREELTYTASVVTLTLLGFAIRIRYMFFPLLIDEAQTYVAYASKPLTTGLTIYPEPNNHPLNTLLMYISTKLFGNNIASIRLFPFLCGVALIPLTYILFKRIYDRKVGLIASVFVSTGSLLLITHSANGRGYIIQTFLVSLVAYFAVRMKRENKGWVGFTIASVLSFYTLPTTLYFFGGIVLWLFLSGLYQDTSATRKSFIRKLIIVCFLIITIVVLLYLPFVIGSGLDSIVGNKYVRRMPLEKLFNGLYITSKTIYRDWGASVIPLFFILLAGFIVSILFHKKISTDRVNISLPVVGGCLLLVTVQAVVPFARTWTPLLPLFFGFSSAGLYFIGQKVTALIKTGVRPKPYLLGLLAVGLGVILLAAVYPASLNRYENFGEYQRMQHRTLTEDLKNTLEEGDLVYAGPLSMAQLEYYFMRNDIPLEHLYGNLSGENMPVDDIKRIIIITDMSHKVLGQAVSQSNIEFNDRFPLEKMEDWTLTHVLFYGLPDNESESR